MPHVAEHVGVLLHVAGTHVLGQAGGGGLHAAELGGILCSVAERQRRVLVEVSRFHGHLAKLLDAELAEDVTRFVGLAHIHLDAAVGLMHGGERFTRLEVDDFVLLHRLIRLAPADHGNVEHEIAPLKIVRRCLLLTLSKTYSSQKGEKLKQIEKSFDGQHWSSR